MSDGPRIKWIPPSTPVFHHSVADCETCGDLHRLIGNRAAYTRQWEEYGTVQTEALAAARRDLSEAVEMLRRCEWGDHNEAEEALCPVCQHLDYRGHATDCRLAALLSRFPEKG